MKARVKITGEFWLQIHGQGDGNYNIKTMLKQEDSEFVPPPIVWLFVTLPDASGDSQAREAQPGQQTP